MGRNQQVQGAFKWTMMAVVILVATMLAGTATATTTWGQSSGANRDVGTTNNGLSGAGADPYTCTPFPGGTPSDTTCVSGGTFLDGNPSFAVGRSGTNHNLFAVWAADRWSGDKNLPLVPYSNACGVASNPGRNNLITNMSRTSTDSYPASVTGFTVRKSDVVYATNDGNVSRNIYTLDGPPDPSNSVTGGISTGDQVSIQGVVMTDPRAISAVAGTGTSRTFTYPFSGAAIVAAGDRVKISGAGNASYNGEFTVTATGGTGQNRTFSVTYGTDPGATSGALGEAISMGRPVATASAAYNASTGTVGTLTFAAGTGFAAPYAIGESVNLSGFSPARWNGGYLVQNVTGSAGAGWTVTINLSTGGYDVAGAPAAGPSGPASVIGNSQKGEALYNGPDLRVVDGAVSTTISIGGKAPGAGYRGDGSGGSLWVVTGTFSVSPNNFEVGDAVPVQAGTAGSGYVSPTGTTLPAFDAWVVQSASGSTFTANVHNDFDPVFGYTYGNGSVTVWRSVATAVTQTDHGFTPGQSRANVTGYTGQGAKYNGIWPVISGSGSTFSFTFDVIGGTPGTVLNGGNVGKTPYCEGVYFSKTATIDGGSGAWSEPKLLSQGVPAGEPNDLSKQHNEFYAVAADGTNVAAVFAPTSGYYSQMCPSSPRPGYVTISTDSGATWNTPVRITDAGARIGYPNIAVSGDDIYVASSATPNGVDPRILVGNPAAPPDFPVNVWHTTFSAPTSVDTYVAGYTSSTYEWGTKPSGCDSTLAGYDPQPGIAASGNDVGIMFVRDNTGAAIIKISHDKGASWSLGCGVGSPSDCIQRIKAGAKGYVFGQSTTSCVEWDAGNPYKAGACALANISAAAVPETDATHAEFGFAWISADRLPAGEGGYTNAYPVNTAVPGVYTKTWRESGGWGPTIRISCFTLQGLCNTPPAPAASVYGYGYGPSITAFGTQAGSGYAVAWTGCRIMTGPDCGQTAQDPGEEIVLKESLNGGLGWGGDWGTVSSFNTVVTAGTAEKQINEYPGVVYDSPGQSYTGCLLGASSTDAACNKYIGYLSRNRAYTVYQLMVALGTT